MDNHYLFSISVLYRTLFVMSTDNHYLLKKYFISINKHMTLNEISPAYG